MDKGNKETYRVVMKDMYVTILELHSPREINS